MHRLAESVEMSLVFAKKLFTIVCHNTGKRCTPLFHVCANIYIYRTIQLLSFCLNYYITFKQIFVEPKIVYT